MGTEWKSRVRPKEDLEITAYHEAGHTLVALLTKDSMPLHKVTILAKGGSGGHTGFTIPENMQWHETKSQMLANMDVSMGGRIAEELIFGTEKITGGASSDLAGATQTAVSMVKKLGMSEKVGLRVQYDDPVQNMEYGPSTRELTDEEINRLLNESYKRATDLLTKHKKELILLAEALLKYETLDAEDVRCIVQQKRPPTASQKPTSPGGTSVPAAPGRRPLPPLPPLPLPATETLPTTESSPAP